MESLGTPSTSLYFRIPEYIFNFTTILFSLFILLLVVHKQKHVIRKLLFGRLWCKCDICQAYLTSSWTQQFPNLCDWITHLLQNSPIQTIHIHVLNNIITASPKSVEYILKTRFENYPKGKKFSSILGDLLGKGIFNVDGDSWLFQRKKASVELQKNAVQSYAFEIINHEIETRLIPLLQSTAGDVLGIKKTSSSSSNVINLQDILRRFTFDTICKFSFGLDPRCLELSMPVSQFAEAFDLATKLSAERALAISPLVWKIQRCIGIGKERQLKKAIKVVDDLAKAVIREKVLQLNSNNCSCHQQDLLSRFMRSIKDEDYLRDIVVSFILAGRDSVASALTSFIWLVSKNRGVIEKIRQEHNNCNVLEGRITYDQVKGMHYLHAAVYESMRLYPPVQFDSKFALEDDLLPDDSTTVQKGDRVTFHIYAMGRMGNIWGSDYMEFKPERWIKDGVFNPSDNFRYPVFQGGVRVCLGKELALMQIKSVALALLTNFDVEVVGSSDVLRFEPGLTASVRGGVNIAVKERRN